MRRPRHQPQHDRAPPLEHRFTDTPDLSHAGTWWARHEIVPWCTWTFDADRRVFVVHRGSQSRELQLPSSAVPRTSSEEQSILPTLALHLARLIERERHPPASSFRKQ